MQKSIVTWCLNDYEHQCFETVALKMKGRSGRLRTFMPHGPYYLGEGIGLVVFRMCGFGLGFKSGKVWEQMGQPCLALTMS